jgi:AcrR family transcriptional regulator
VETRERIVGAARRVILGKGLVRATTKEIAREAGVSEGTLYNHFANKEAMFLQALGQLRSGFFPLVQGLPERAGNEPVRAVLGEVARVGLAFYGEAIPMGASIFADPELLARHRELLAQRHAGPQRANELLAAYLKAEQDLGHIRAGADPEAISYLLLGAIYQRAYWREFLGQAADPSEDEHFIEQILDMLELAVSPVTSGAESG